MLPNLKVENLSCVRSEKAIFKNLNFEVLPGQNIEIIGSNGSGKTTLLRTLLGLINKEEGIINWLDEDNNFNEYRTFDCFYQGHQMGIKNMLTVFENLKLTHNAKGMNEQDINKCLERVGLYKINEMASDLSVGQKKRISIARWLLKDFKIYFIDEPFSALVDPASDLIKEIIKEAHIHDARVLIDGAQSAPHIKTDLIDLNADFYVTSAHKLCGPTGVGFLYGKETLLNELPPYQGGGEMISEVTFEKTLYADLPHKFEAGTPNISGVIAFGAALDYINEIGLKEIENYENELLEYATKKLKEIKGLRIFGEAKNKISVISFNVGSIHPYDLGSILDKMGIAVRTGQHCAQPVMDYYEIPGTVRVSFSFYNTKKEIDFLILAINKAIKMLS